MPTARNESYTVGTGGVIKGGISSALSGNRYIVIWGSSHVIGRADQTDLGIAPLSSDSGLQTLMDGTFSRVKIWTGATFENLVKAKNGATAGQFGMEFALATRWERETTSGILYINKYGVSGAGLTSYYPGQTDYNGAKTESDQANTWFTTNSVTLTSRDCIWDSTADTAQTQSWYETRLTDMLNQWLTDGVRTSASKVLIFQAMTGGVSYSAAMANAKIAVAATNPTKYLIMDPPTTGYIKGDNTHQNGRGQMWNGYNAFEVIFSTTHIAI